MNFIALFPFEKAKAEENNSRAHLTLKPTVDLLCNERTPLFAAYKHTTFKIPSKKELFDRNSTQKVMIAPV